MNAAWVRKVCLSLPHTTETLQWGEHLVFKVSGKMFAITALEPARVCLTFKTTPEEFDTLMEIPGLTQAPYCAKRQWAALEAFDALPAREVERLLKRAYELIYAKLPAKVRTEIESAKERPATAPSRSSRDTSKSRSARSSR